jgi:ATP phosphoribosyltransferase regulatory subunit
LFSGAGASLMDETFRVMDPISHRMMGVRSDITPQIVRIASSRLMKEPRPLRVCYANDVLRTKAGQQRTERQFTQVGCEIVGEQNIESDIESCVVALIALNEIGLKDITIDLAYPSLIAALFDQQKITEDKRTKIKSAFEKKSADGLKKLPPIFKELLKSSGPADQAFAKLKSLGLRGDVKTRVQKLEKIYKGIQKAIGELGLKNVKITIDPTETRGFKYYTGFGFTLFAKGVAGALGRGGHYDIRFGGKSEGASGFTLYTDTLRKAMPPAKNKKIIQVSYGENWAKIRKAQQKGAIVIRGKRKK